MATAKNSYAILSDFLQWVTPSDTSVDIVDDAVINSILEAVSRYIDDQTNRYFYPTIEAYKYDVPQGRSLYLDEDLLEVITLANGDDTTLTTSNYNLYPTNSYPKNEIKIKQTSTQLWVSSSTTETAQVIDLSAWFGYHSRYNRRAWARGSNDKLGAAISNTSSLDWTAAGSHAFKEGQIVKIDSEIQIIDSISTNTITPFARGDNGSTVATHDDETEIYIWQPEPSISIACKQIAQQIWRRFGASQGDENIVTASGVIITPRDVPGIANKIIMKYKVMT